MKLSIYKFLALISAVFIASAVPANAGTPPVGSAERRAILNALRPAIEAQIGPNVEFVVGQFNLAGGWAFVQAEPRRKGGRQIVARNYFSSDELERMDGLTVTALLQYRYGRWNVIEKAIGATDAWYCGIRPAYAVTHCQ